MLLFFKAGWIRWSIGAVLLAIALWFVHDFRERVPPLEHLPPLERHYHIPPVRSWGAVLKWVGIGLGIEFGALLAVCLVGILLLPKHFLRWVTREPARLFSNGGLFLALAGGLMAALLEEPLFRLELQPELVREMTRSDGQYLVALIFAACYWTPYTNLLAIWAFPRSLLFSYLSLVGGVGWIPMLAHGIGDFVYLYLFSRLGAVGLTHEGPATPTLFARVEESVSAKGRD